MLNKSMFETPADTQPATIGPVTRDFSPPPTLTGSGTSDNAHYDMVGGAMNATFSATDGPTKVITHLIDETTSVTVESFEFDSASGISSGSHTFSFTPDASYVNHQFDVEFVESGGTQSADVFSNLITVTSAATPPPVYRNDLYLTGDANTTATNSTNHENDEATAHYSFATAPMSVTVQFIDDDADGGAGAVLSQTTITNGANAGTVTFIPTTMNIPVGHHLDAYVYGNNDPSDPNASYSDNTLTITAADQAATGTVSVTPTFTQRETHVDYNASLTATASVTDPDNGATPTTGQFHWYYTASGSTTATDVHDSATGVTTDSFTPGATEIGGTLRVDFVSTDVNGHTTLFAGTPYAVTADVDGTAGNDLLAGTTGVADNIYGYAGDDTIAGNTDTMNLDTVDGGTGSNTIDFTGVTNAVSILLGPGTASLIVNGTSTPVDDLTNVENATGGSGNDNIVGDNEANHLSGGVGDDSLAGGAGNDTLDGGAGTDTVFVQNLTAANGIASTVSDGHGGYVTTLTNGNDSDTLINIEHITFASNVTVNFNADHSATIIQAHGDTNAVNAGQATTVAAASGVLANDLDIDKTMSVSKIVSSTGTDPVGSGTTNATGPTILGTYGDLTIGADGSYVYYADHASSLARGVTGDDIFTYTVTNGDTANAQTATLDVTVTGINHAPTVTSFAGAATSDATATYTLDLLTGHTSDADGDTVTVDASSITVTASYGGDIPPSNITDFTYSPTNGLVLHPSDFASLQVDQSATLTIGYNVTDGHGGTTPNTATVLVNGTNQSPVFTGTLSGDITQGATTATTGDVTVADPDNSTAITGVKLQGAAAASGLTATGLYGTFTITAAGHWSYTLNSNAVVPASNATEHFIVNTADTSATGEVDITVHAVTGASFTGSGHAGDPLTLTYTQASDDKATSIDASIRDVTKDDAVVSTSGSFTPNASTQNGDVFQGVLIEHYADGSSHEIDTGTITFTDAAPTVSTANPAAGDDTTDAGKSFTVDLLSNASDTDKGDTVALVANSVTASEVITHADMSTTTQSVTLTTDYTTHMLTVDPSAFQSLQAGESAKVTVSYTVEDGNHATTADSATFTITGTDQKPVLGGTTTGVITEGATAPASGTLTVTDPDNSNAITGASFLGDGTATTSKTAVRTVGVTQGALAHADATVQPITATGNYGTFSIDSTGHWTYTLDPAKAATLGGNLHPDPVERFSVSTVDGTATGEVDITVHGTDTPATHTGSYVVFTDDTKDVTVNLLDDTSDPDDALSVSKGSLVVNLLDSHGKFIETAPAGSYVFDPTTSNLTVHGAAFDALAAGQSYQISANYTVTGDTGGGDFTDARVVVINGTDQAPTVSGPLSAAISETDLPQTFNLLANASDVDGPSLTVVTTGANAPTVTVTDSSGTKTTLSASDYTLAPNGSFTLKSDPTTGSYTDKLHLGDHDTITVSYTISDDGTNTDAKTVSTTETITLNGSAEQVYGNGTFSGTAYADVIHGSYGPPAAAGAGYVTVNPTTVPTLDNPATHDSINGGDGNDTIYGGDGDSTLAGNAGNDVIHGGSGTNMIYGGQGDDMLIGGSGNDSIEGGIGNDTIDGAGGINTATYTADKIGINADLRLEYSNASTTTPAVTPLMVYAVTGGSGNDYLTNIQNLSGGSGSDTIHGSDSFSSILQGNDGNDVITAGNLASADTKAGDQSTLYGNVGNDTLYGGLGNDSINGGQGDDVVFASTGYDVLVGGKDSTLNADGVTHASYNALDTSGMLSNLHGDTLVFSQITVLDPNGTNLANDPSYFDGVMTTHFNGVIVDLSLTTQQATYTDSAGHAAFDTISGFENLVGSNFNDALNGDANANVIAGLDGDDRLQGNDGNDTIFGGNGNDTIYGNTGDDVLFGNAGNDTLVGGQGNDVLHGGTGANMLTGGLGIDTFVLSYSTDTATQTNSIVTTTTGTTTTTTIVSDTITDFSGTGGQGDKIDLSEVSAFAHENLHFVGNFFTGTAGDVIVTQGNGAGHYLLEIDLNGDGQADFIANVNGAATTNGGHAAAPVAGDFMGLTYTAPATPVNAQVHIDHHADLFG